MVYSLLWVMQDFYHQPYDPLGPESRQVGSGCLRALGALGVRGYSALGGLRGLGVWGCRGLRLFVALLG